MSFTSVLNNNTVTKKCGEIIITMKKNAKSVYSFNCWFCDTICVHLKKFTLHLEQEHVTQLEETTFTINTDAADTDNFGDKICAVKERVVGNISVGEIKIEDYTNDDIKSETGDENEPNVTSKWSPRFQDPLETFEEKLEGITLQVPVKNEIPIVSNPDKNILLSEIGTHFSDDERRGDNLDLSGDDNSTDSEGSADEKCIKFPKLKRKAKDKELILALIAEYSKTPQLWSTSLADRCNLKQKDELLQEMIDNLNTKLNMKLKLYVVKKKLNFICKQYENEIERQVNETEKKNAKEISKLWFYENMSFLKSTIESKLKFKRKKPNLKVKPLNDDLLCELIGIYKNYNSLWNVNHLAYTVKDKRRETMQSMLAEVKQQMNLFLDTYKLEKHLNFIHKTFAKDKLYKLECQAKEKDFQPLCSYFNKCDFLEAHQGPFKCTNCSEIIETYNDYQVHTSQHDGSIPFKCQECGMGFKKISNYTIHAKRHLRVFKFHCEICGKGYPFNAELDLHMRSHTGAQPYLCSVCGEGFRTAISYDNHIRRHEERFKYFCHICKKGFNHMTRLNDHVKAHLNVRDVICTVCGKGFTSRKYLNHHKRIHEGKNYSCNICGKSFAQDAGLRAHKKYHGTPIGISSIQKEQNKNK